MSRDLIERARELKAQMMEEVRVIKVQELGDDNGPLEIYVKPLTTKELQKILKGGDAVERAATTIDVRARDKDGNRMFAGEKNEIMRHFPPKLIHQIARAINEDLDALYGEDSVEEAGN